MRLLPEGKADNMNFYKTEKYDKDFLAKEYGKCPVFLRHGRTGWVQTIPMPQKTGKCSGQTAEDI